MPVADVDVVVAADVVTDVPTGCPALKAATAPLVGAFDVFVLGVAIGFATAATVPPLALAFAVFALSDVFVDEPFSAGDSEIVFESLATGETSPVTSLSEVVTEVFS